MSPTMDHNFPTKITVLKLNPRRRLIQPVSAVSSEASISIRLALSFHPHIAMQNTREKGKTYPTLQRQMLGNGTSSTSCPPRETPQASMMALQAQSRSPPIIPTAPPEQQHEQGVCEFACSFYNRTPRSMGTNTERWSGLTYLSNGISTLLYEKGLEA